MNETNIVNSIDLEEQKRKEYEQWFKTQEREQQALEYDCSVKYEASTTSTNLLEGMPFPIIMGCPNLMFT